MTIVDKMNTSSGPSKRWLSPSGGFGVGYVMA